MAERTETEPRKLPTQQRSQLTFEAMIEATARVLEREGTAALTTNRIAEVAGVSIGTLYQYFPSKEALVAQVIEARLAANLEDMRQFVDALDEAASAETILSMIATQLVAHHKQRGRLMRELLALIEEADRRELVVEHSAMFSEGLRQLLATRRDELRPELRGEDSEERFELAVYMAWRAAELLVNTTLLERPEALESDAFAELLRRMITAPLLVQASSPGV